MCRSSSCFGATPSKTRSVSRDRPSRIGRDSRNDIVLDDSLKGVSRFHAEVRAEAGTYFIVDLKSRNGVWMNGRRIKEKAALALGVPVTLGAYELALEDDVSVGGIQCGGAFPLSRRW